MEKLFGRMFAPITSEWVESTRFSCHALCASHYRSTGTRHRVRKIDVLSLSCPRFLSDAMVQSVNRDRRTKVKLRRDPCAAPRIGEMFEKGRAKNRRKWVNSGERQKNNITRNAAVLRTKVYPIHEGHTYGTRPGPRNLRCILYNTIIKIVLRKSGK